MFLSRWVRDHRPVAVLAALVLSSLTLLASGAQGGALASGVRNAAGSAIHPFEVVFEFVQNGFQHGAALVFRYGLAERESRDLRQKLVIAMDHTSQRQELLSENARLRGILAFEKKTPQITFLAVSVIRSFEGMLTIDRGSLHGLRESMCVITADGVVGMIAQTDLYTSNVITLQNASCHVDAMISGSRIRGRVRGTGNDLSKICVMEYIDLAEGDNVRPGDLVVTSPESVFPTGYPIGRVQEVNQERGPLSMTASVLPAADPFRVDEVFVVLQSDEKWEELTGLEPTPPPLEAWPGLQGAATVQERFAP